VLFRSASAPHVSGVAALLLSKYNKNCYSQINLDPADVEYILQESAVDVDSADYDVNSGWGRLDARAALDMIDFPTLQIVHPHDSILSLSLVEVDTISLNVDETFYQFSDGTIGINYPLENKFDYRAERLKYEIEYYFGDYILPSTELLDVWIRHSQTNSLGLYNDTTAYDTLGFQFLETIDTFDILPMSEIISFTDSTITLSGYYYHFIGKYTEISGVEGPIEFAEDYWYPIDPNVTTPKMAYSIYIRDSTLLDRYDFDCDLDNPLFDTLIPYLNSNELDNFEILIYPNPTDSELNIELTNGLNGQLELRDIQGKLIQYIDMVADKKKYYFNVQNLNSGIFLLNLNGDTVTKTFK